MIFTIHIASKELGIGIYEELWQIHRKMIKKNLNWQKQEKKMYRKCRDEETEKC